MSESRHLEIANIGDVTVVRFVDRKILDEANIQEIGGELYGLAEDANINKLLLNFSNVEFLSSAALGKLITLDKKTKTKGATLKLCDIKDEIMEVFRITRLDRVFDIHDDEADALNAM